MHKLIILHARLTDAGDVTCRCVGQNETTAKLTVNKLQPPDGDAGDQETGDGLSDQEVRDQIVSLIAAGYDTTASAMGWAVAELARHPERVDKIRAEMLDAGAGRSLTIEQTTQLTYTNAFIEEVLRLHPPAIWSGRRVVNDFEIDNRTIPGGSMILFSPHVTHHDPRSFPDPADFRPGRWIDGHADQNHPHPYSYIPFGGGNRRCLGFAFATQELVAMTALLANRTDLELVNDGPQRHVGTMSSAPEGGTQIQILRIDDKT